MRAYLRRPLGLHIIYWRILYPVYFHEHKDTWLQFDRIPIFPADCSAAWQPATSLRPRPENNPTVTSSDFSGVDQSDTFSSATSFLVSSQLTVFAWLPKKTAAGWELTALSQLRVCVFHLPKGPSKDQALAGHNHILLPGNQWDGRAFDVFPGCVSVVLLRQQWNRRPTPLLNTVAVFEYWKHFSMGETRDRSLWGPVKVGKLQFRESCGWIFAIG